MTERTELTCLRCGQTMRYLKRECLQRRKHGWFIQDWDYHIAGALDVEIWACPGCRKLEFFWSSVEAERLKPEEDEEVQIICVQCRQAYEINEERCPFCGTYTDAWNNRIAQVKCPQCGQIHDIDEPKCPSCGKETKF